MTVYLILLIYSPFHIGAHMSLGITEAFATITSALPSISFHHHPPLLLEYQLFVQLSTLPAFSTTIF